MQTCLVILGFAMAVSCIVELAFLMAEQPEPHSFGLEKASREHPQMPNRTVQLTTGRNASGPAFQQPRIISLDYLAPADVCL